ncbi:MAG: phosphoribosylglycinamide formyltransferase [Actinomycetota bacterium]
MTTRIAILASGSGTIAQALLDASAAGQLGDGQVVVLISDRADAIALGRAKSAGVEDLYVNPDDFSDRKAYSHALAEELVAREVTLVCLAGFMKILSPEFIRPFAGRILNTHAALLPSFIGAHPVRDTLAWGAKVTGATIHLVDEEVDHGPIVLQQAVDVEPNDDEASLTERIKQVERQIFPAAVRLMLSGRLHMNGRVIRIQDNEGINA